MKILLKLKGKQTWKMAKTYVNNNYEFILIRIVYIQIYIFCYKKFKNGIKEWKTNLVKLFRSNLAKYLIQIVFVNKVLENKIDGQNVYTLITQQKYIRLFEIIHGMFSLLFSFARSLFLVFKSICCDQFKNILFILRLLYSYLGRLKVSHYLVCITNIRTIFSNSSFNLFIAQ